LSTALRRRSAFVIVTALVAAFSTLFVFGASDAAQAYVKPPPQVTSLGARALPRSLALVVPGAGAAVGVGMLGAAAWENREVIIPLAESAWCQLTNCDASQGEEPPPQEWVRPDSPQSRIGTYPSSECFVSDLKVRPTNPPSEFVTLTGQVQYMEPEPMPPSFGGTGDLDNALWRSIVQTEFDSMRWCAPSGIAATKALPQGFVQDVFCKSPVTGLSLRQRKPLPESSQGAYGDYLKGGLTGTAPVKLCPTGTVVAWASIFAPNWISRYSDDWAGAMPWPWFGEYADKGDLVPRDRLGDPSDKTWPNPSFGGGVYDSGEPLTYAEYAPPEPCLDPLGFPCANPNSSLVGATECTHVITGVKRVVESPAGKSRIVFPGCGVDEYVSLRITMLGPWSEGEFIGLNGTEIPPGISPGPMLMPDTVRMENDYQACLSVDGCALQVVLDGDPCAVGGRCYDWWSIRQSTPDRLRCNWGPYNMPLADCDPLRFTYRTGYTVPDPSGRPEPLPSTAPSPGGSPSPELDPETQPDKPPSPNPNPNPNPEPPGDPESPVPPIDPDADGCSMAGNGWNPVNYIVDGVKCALVWAFVPDSSAVQSLIGSVKDAWSDTAPGQWVSALAGVAGEIGSEHGGCAGPSLTISDGKILSSTTLQPFNACTTPVSTVAFYVKTGLSVVAVVGTFLACVGMLAQSMGYRAPLTEPEQLTLF
jgi:hypothetical protein